MPEPAASGARRVGPGLCRGYALGHHGRHLGEGALDGGQSEINVFDQLVESPAGRIDLVPDLFDLAGEAAKLALKGGHAYQRAGGSPFIDPHPCLRLILLG